jgi:hypothetical protein
MKYIIMPAKMPGLSKLFGGKKASGTAGKKKQGGSHR